jgi:small subunit ribosomal protein S20
MNKKQRNRKLVKQNKRNRIQNRRYSSTIKNLSKLFKTKVKMYSTLNETNLDEKPKLKFEVGNIINNLYSILDKAVKKKVIHKNKAARKKSSIYQLSKKFNNHT